MDDMLEDYWAHHYRDNPKALQEIEDTDFNLEDELAKMEAEDGSEIL